SRGCGRDPGGSHPKETSGGEKWWMNPVNAYCWRSWRRPTQHRAVVHGRGIRVADHARRQLLLTVDAATMGARVPVRGPPRAWNAAARRTGSTAATLASRERIAPKPRTHYACCVNFWLNRNEADG